MSRTRWTQLGAMVCLAGMLGWLARSDPPAESAGLGSSPAIDPGAKAASSAPCAVPMTWRLTRLDPEFGLDPAEALDAVRLAARLWGSVLDRRAFEEAASGALEIRIIYDDRQRRADLRSAREAEIVSRWTAIDTDPNASNQERVAAFEAYERAVAELRADFPDVAFEAATYHEAVSTESPATVRSREIRVYRFDGSAELSRVLAHEMGHALGLAHSADAGSIMSERYMGGDISGGLTVSAGDVDALKKACGVPE